MLHWTLLSELYSFGILLILFVRYSVYERRATQTKQRRMFAMCLLASMGFIALNALCVFTLANPDVVPRVINIALNTLYFLVSIILCSCYAYMLFEAMLEHVYDKHCLRRASIMLFTVTAVASLLTLVNLFTGVVFTIDEAGIYRRGPLNQVYYLFLVTELIFLCICYIRNRRSVSDKMLYVIRSMPLLILLICGLQLLYPDVLLNGTICAIASLMIFLAFRSSTDEHDALTGAHSHKAFVDELALRTGSAQAIQLIQVTILNISDINNRYDHTTGDAMLYEVANYLRHSFPHVRVFRTGGTTFTVLLPMRDEEEAEVRLQTIRNRLQAVWTLGETSCTLKVGIAELRKLNFNESPTEVVEQIEYTMTLAKKTASLIRYDSTVREQMERRTRLLALMRRSIDEHRFTVHYQPLYCCHKDIFCSAEALLRLTDEDGNSVSPEVFIPLAEQNNMIGELTSIVLEDICRLFSSGKLPCLQSVSINLSMKQLLDPTLPGQIRAYLDRCGVAPSCLKVEITERFLLHDARYAKRQMEALEAMGIEIYMDDFGTGYSNLSSVLQFPFSFIKLDRSLITPIAENEHALAMVAALTKLFQDMGKRVVAEGVEMPAQVEVLRELGIDMIQGFHYAKPMPPEALIPYFAAR